MVTTLQINGTAHAFDVAGDTPLLWVLREELGLTGTKFGCGVGICGACTVQVDGAAATSCTAALEDCEGRSIVTIEGLAPDASHPLQLAWIAEQVPQCGYCQPGMIMAVAALLKTKPKPSDDEIATGLTNLCRCGTYVRIRRAIHRAVGA